MSSITGIEKLITVISEKGEVTWEDLKKQTGYSSPVLSKHLKKLINLGLIDEKIHPKDRRRKIYRLKPKEETLEIVAQKHAEILITYSISENILKDPEKTIGELVLLCYAGGETGRKLLPEILEYIFEILKKEKPELIESYSKKFKSFLASSRKEIKKVYEKSGVVKLPETVMDKIIELAAKTALETIIESKERED